MVTTEAEAQELRRTIADAVDRNFGRVADAVQNESLSALFLPNSLPLLRQALDEIRADQWPASVRAAILNISIEALNAHGLYGSQLALKVNLTDQQYNRFEGFSSGGILNRARRKVASSLLSRFMRIFDKWLKSVLDAAGVGGLYDEFKGLVEESLDDDPDWLPPERP